MLSLSTQGGVMPFFIVEEIQKEFPNHVTSYTICEAAK